MTKRKYDAKFKAQVALDAVRERETLKALAVKYDVSPAQIGRWKKEFLDYSAEAFEKPEIDYDGMEDLLEIYERKICDLEEQLDFAKRVSEKLGIEIPASN